MAYSSAGYTIYDYVPPEWTFHTFNRTLNGFVSNDTLTSYRYGLVGDDHQANGTISGLYLVTVKRKSFTVHLALMGIMASLALVGLLIFTGHTFFVHVKKSEYLVDGYEEDDFVKIHEEEHEAPKFTDYEL